MIRPVDVAHVNLNVTDLERAIRFYTELLGFTVAFRYEGAVAWLNFGQYREGTGGLGQGVHDLALYKVPVAAPEDRRKRAGMNHLALRLRTPREVDSAASRDRRRTRKIATATSTSKIPTAT
jgi:catechol 2,3-dioxygenase-like lactoylglutathione lyase family enzyme